jgi:RNA-directed DNA polymerase
LFVADVQYNRLVGIVVRLTRARDSDGRAKVENAGSEVQFDAIVPALEDKIVQKAVSELLTAIYEQDFLNCSYGFRPGRGAQDALDEVDRAMWREPISRVLELDITSYFDSIVREQLMEMIERRISDASILRLIRKWINIGVIDDGRLLVSETGTGQGQIISPLHFAHF